MAEVDAELAKHPGTKERIERVLKLVEGYESPYGLELLASVHWVAAHDPTTRSDPERAAEAVQAWTDRKRRLFTEDHVVTAWHTLSAARWLPEAA